MKLPYMYGENPNICFLHYFHEKTNIKIQTNILNVIEFQKLKINNRIFPRVWVCIWAKKNSFRPQEASESVYQVLRSKNKRTFI